MCLADHLGGNFCSGLVMFISPLSPAVSAVLGFASRVFRAAALEADLVMILALCCYARSVTAFRRKVKETRGLAHEPLVETAKR